MILCFWNCFVFSPEVTLVKKRTKNTEKNWKTHCKIAKLLSFIDGPDGFFIFKKRFKYIELSLFLRAKILEKSREFFNFTRKLPTASHKLHKPNSYLIGWLILPRAETVRNARVIASGRTQIQASTDNLHIYTSTVLHGSSDD